MTGIWGGYFTLGAPWAAISRFGAPDDVPKNGEPNFASLASTLLRLLKDI